MKRFNMENVSRGYDPDYEMVRDDEYGDYVLYEDFEREEVRLLRKIEQLVVKLEAAERVISCLREVYVDATEGNDYNARLRHDVLDALKDYDEVTK